MNDDSEYDVDEDLNANDDQSEEQKNEEDDNVQLKNVDIEQRREFRELRDKIKTLTSAQLKSVLSHLRSLRSIDGEAPLENVSMTGNKQSLQKKILLLLAGIYLGKLVVEDKNNWLRNYKVYAETIDFDGWKLQIKQNLNLVSSFSTLFRGNYFRAFASNIF